MPFSSELGRNSMSRRGRSLVQAHGDQRRGDRVRISSDHNFQTFSVQVCGVCV